MITNIYSKVDTLESRLGVVLDSEFRELTETSHYRKEVGKYATSSS